MIESKSLSLMLCAFIVIVGTCTKESNGEAIQPRTIPRASWHARSPRSEAEHLSINPPPFVIIHHSETPSCTSQEKCSARVRNIQHYHMDEKKWDDIGYNFLVGEDGNVYFGRGWNVRGAHSVEYNTKSIGICMIGNFTDHVPNQAAVTAAKNMIDWGVSRGDVNASYILYGHRQTSTTDCPGTKLYEMIQSWPHWQSN